MLSFVNVLNTLPLVLALGLRVDSAAGADAANKLVGFNGQLCQAVAADNTVLSFVNVLNALPLVLALGLRVDSATCTDATHKLVGLSTQLFTAVTANYLVACLIEVLNTLPLMLALGLGVDSATCTDATNKLVGLSAQLLTAVAAEYSVSCLIDILNALPLMLASCFVHFVTAGIAEAVAVVVSVTSSNTAECTADTAGELVLVLINLDRLALKVMSAQSAALALAGGQIAVLGHLIFVAIAAGDGMSTVTIVLNALETMLARCLVHLIAAGIAETIAVVVGVTSSNTAECTADTAGELVLVLINLDRLALKVMSAQSAALALAGGQIAVLGHLIFVAIAAGDGMSTVTIVLNALETMLARCLVHLIAAGIAETIAVVVGVTSSNTAECTADTAGELVFVLINLDGLALKVVGAQSAALALTGRQIVLLGHFVLVAVTAGNGVSTVAVILDVLEAVLASCFIHLVVTCIAETITVVISVVHGSTIECTTNAAGNLMLLVADLNDLAVKIVSAQSAALALAGRQVVLLGHFVLVAVTAGNGMSTVTIVLDVLEAVLASCFIHLVVTCIAETVTVDVSMIHGSAIECAANAAGNLMLLVADLNDLAIKVVGAQSAALALAGRQIVLLGHFVLIAVTAGVSVSTIAVVLQVFEAMLASFLCPTFANTVNKLMFFLFVLLTAGALVPMVSCVTLQLPHGIQACATTYAMAGLIHRVDA